MRVTDRLSATLSARGYDYPRQYVWLVPLTLCGAAICAVGQRHALLPFHIVVLAGLAIVTECVLSVVLGWNSHLVFVTVNVVASYLLMRHSVEVDFTPIVLITMTIAVAATSSWRVSLPATAAAVVTLILSDLSSQVERLYIAGVLFAWLVGCMMLTQLRLLHQERATHASRAAEAAGDERRRIAREVHDVVAHSLSITLLHVTGARRALQQDRDIDDAIEALTDAERIGRQAMTDIRRTVGLLDMGPSTTAPEPDLDDIDDLIADFRRAGLPVGYERCGNFELVTAATGLGVYRIAQESLANVAKHSPGSRTGVELRIEQETVELSIVNTRCATVESTGGSGIDGMRRRAELLGGTLTAGPDGTKWAVHAVLPLMVSDAHCPIGLVGRQ
ncbi:two-component sensor histidine kinase [Antrihabitans sp. YC3-6]|uniref:histidine kinase n=1 Tax=Antrihabitans stalagmiti TaxID=2799499 RepID=A0A934NQS6_9NOCA|nr:histidine kinase [Antrihabitans stalagmiti]MBJ8339744.1 two-component sensor histidine kinase [Antrihabitans stalagmiti]